MSRITLRAKIVALSTILLAPMLTAIAWAPAAEATPASADHPYSAPSWYPLHDGVVIMDCVRSNPGCPSGHGHTDESMTLLTKRTANPNSYYNAPVYAAGAGVAHIGYSGMQECHPVAGKPLGNWVWVYHGAGIISRYAHLTNIKVHEGQLVTQSTVIGYSSSTGEPAAQCYIKYLNFQVQHNAINGFGTGYPLTTSVACSRPGSHTTVSYPKAFGYNGWNAVPKDTPIPWGGRVCLPTTVANTHSRPVNSGLTPTGTSSLKLSWPKPLAGPTVTRITVELQKRNSSGAYYYILPAYRALGVSPFPLSHTFTGLAHGTYRARLSYLAGAGWSVESYWKYATLG